MSSKTVRWTKFASVAVACVVLASCEKLSDVGDQAGGVPTSISKAVGYAAPDASGNLSIDVRAQSQVLLTGKDSVEVDKPIVSYLWEPANTAANSAMLTVRNTNTIAVQLPMVATVTDMQFRLTVTDSDGDKDTSTATLRVQPVLDSDRFLQYFRSLPVLKVVAGTSQSAAGQFRIDVRATATYTARSGLTRSEVYTIGTPISGSWAAGTPDADAKGRDPRNPLFRLALPGIDLDEIVRKVQAGLPQSAPNMPDPAYVDAAKLQLKVTLTPLSGVISADLYVLNKDDVTVKQATNSGSGGVVELDLTDDDLDALRLASGGVENRQTAVSYGAALDRRFGARATLDDWLIANCFVPGAANYGADAHAVYVNNYDLGFGRDMYFKTTKPAACSSPTFRVGDSASVVINYATLEGAAKKVDPVIAVAMEYHASPTAGTPGLVTFYAFAPDLKNGGFKRVHSANFDGRGEKPIPGACTACHGGRPKAPAATVASTYNELVDGGLEVGATFMPWDLESFLYSDTDSAFASDATNATLRASLLRSQQEGEFKKLNSAALATYGTGLGANFSCFAGFEGPCELVHNWYGGVGMTSATFLDKKVAPGWVSNAVTSTGTNPATSSDLYLNVFARNCRACHTQRVFASDSQADPQFRTYGSFVQATRPGRTEVIQQVFQFGGMPAARLSMDRLWQSDSALGKSPGQVLAEHLGIAGSKPGASVPCFTPFTASTTTSRLGIERRSPPGIGAPLRATYNSDCSVFATNHEWQLAAPAGATALLSSALGARTAFIPDSSKLGSYDVTLRTTGPLGDTVAVTQFASVNNNLLTAGPPQDVTLALSTPSVQSKNAISVFDQPGDLPSAISNIAVVANDNTNAGFAASLVGSQIEVIAGTAFTQGGYVTYRVTDVDGDFVDKRINVSLTTTVGASSFVNSQSAPGCTSGVSDPVCDPIYIDLTARVTPPTPVGSPGPVITVIGQASRVGPVSGNSTAKVDIVPCVSPGDTSHLCARYSAAPGVVSGTGVVQIAADDTFQWQACLGGNCGQGQVTVPVSATATFESVKTVLEAKCASCHNAGAPVGSAWRLHVGDAKATWCSMRTAGNFKNGVNAGDGYAGDASVPLVDAASPSSSLMYRKPQGLSAAVAINHSAVPAAGNVLDPVTDATQLKTILDWITQGGSFTESATQSCP